MQTIVHKLKLIVAFEFTAKKKGKSGLTFQFKRHSYTQTHTHTRILKMHTYMLRAELDAA